MNQPKIGTNPLNPNDQAANGDSEYSPTPTPVDIFKPRYPAKNYQGVKVAWTLILKNIHANISQNEILVLTSFEDRPGNVWIVVDVDRFPKILSCRSGRSFIVKGEIASVQGQDINLKDCQLVFNLTGKLPPIES